MEHRHGRHKNHPLKLLELAGDHENVPICNACELPMMTVVEVGETIYYGCSDCQYSLHMECGQSLSFVLNSIYCGHTLNLLDSFWPPITNTCSGCNNPIGDGFIYRCDTCNLDFHMRCVYHLDHSQQPPRNFEEEENEDLKELLEKEFPGIVSIKTNIFHPSHHHNLCLFHAQDHCELNCSLCHSSVSNDSVYCCLKSCKFLIHSKCASLFLLSHNIIDGMENTILVTNDQSGSVGDTLNHFSHDHPLVMITKTADNSCEERCDGCGGVVSSTSTYLVCSKTECHFIIHQSCFNLPNKLTKPHLHNHPLNLVSTIQSSSKRSDGLYKCNLCLNLGIGLAYHCQKCNFMCHVQCSHTPYQIKHDVHQHSLVIENSESNPTLAQLPCSCCGCTCSWGFSCQKCNFSMCLSCFTLPIKTKERHAHELTLTRLIGEEYEVNLVCDACETERKSGQHWVYYCADCDFCAHIHCCHDFLLRFAKFDKTIKHKSHHHDLTLVCRPRDMTTECSACGNFYQDLAVFYCEECDFILDISCAFLPDCAIYESSHNHRLDLVRTADDHEDVLGKVYSCDICKQTLSTKVWYYYCSSCDCRVHIQCVAGYPGSYPFSSLLLYREFGMATGLPPIVNITTPSQNVW